MRTKFDVGEEVYLKNSGFDSKIDVFVVKSINIDSERIRYRIKYAMSGLYLTATEDQLESVVQK